MTAGVAAHLSGRRMEGGARRGASSPVTGQTGAESEPRADGRPGAPRGVLCAPLVPQDQGGEGLGCPSNRHLLGETSPSSRLLLAVAEGA